MTLSSLATAYPAQVTESHIKGMTVDEDPVYICKEVDKKGMIFITEETQPEFPGGMSALIEYLQKEMHNPKKFREAGVEGRAVITFVVKKNGNVKDFEVTRSSDNEMLDKEAIRIIKKMPK